ncbi:gamma-glutamylcyclotransferase [Sodalis ligni]|uniref:glutathione-specific gamma-glutamylcyclotransferase n=1 Tax=Sodalis ligni TaxID=2697027 RepID=A0A4R1N6I8_9GAMM|nr:gamma-glutamylcyclotransferase [Sodalis ligni]QWA13587.1 gamma-glutamylcyclotransferase [Sodalis ligni]TCL02712.1 cation transport protein ChaC [Sodalis ligni]
MLTRDFLQKADCKTAFGIIEEALLLTPEQRRASLQSTLERRPDNSPVWIFGYGSLMWNPIFEAEEVRPATLSGWHRAFCLRLIAGRGTVAQPGRMLALKEGGQTTGLAFRLPEDRLHEELELLWKREMLTGCYLPTWSELTLENDEKVTALAFVMDSQHPFFEADTRSQIIAPLIACASGPLGTNAQYLFALEQELNNYGMHDECMVELVHQVRQLLRGKSAINQNLFDGPPF